uniref:IRS-type PTB domain-containing protein n=2 Tax=Clastoptera arizonana TaxID=38151 RepID=A0A1B6E0W3_9HEMI
MGCVSSKTDINDLHPNIFQVMNVDEMGNPLHAGQIEVNEMDLVLYQRGKSPVKWPLKCLRRYGFDAQLFSFECGRRCHTGPGIYAFKCSRAELLFNLLQSQMRNSTTEDTVSGSIDFSSRNGDGNYLEPAPFRQGSNRFSMHHCSNRLGSVGSCSNGPISPIGTTSPSPPPTSNNNYANQETIKEMHRSVSHCYSNSDCVPKEAAPTPLLLYTYANIDIGPTSPNSDSSTLHLDDEKLKEISQESICSPVYMNVLPGQEFPSGDPPPRPLSKPDWDSEEPRHCYANLEPGEIEGLARKHDRAPPPSCQPLTPPQNLTRQVNYIVLDLDQTSSSSSLTGQQPVSPVTLISTMSLPPDITKPSEGYATIDFDKTVALSNSANPCVSDEGVRRTRHNSTISELTTPITEEGTRRTRHNSTISDLVAPITSRLSTSLSD